ncbi:MAG TPA: MFS transporter, partial [Candidatus Baltobacteraceae bacterium]|nr:MFS transporter [Candidatus Baltobacteraceae bacterium]
VAGHALDKRAMPLLLTLGLGVFAGALDLGVLSPALPALGEAFSVQTSDLAWVFTLYLLVTVASIAIASTLADRYGRRPVYVGCVALFALGSLVAVLAPSFGIFLFARVLQALGAGGIFPVATAAIGDVVPKERRGEALGLVAATWGLAAIIGPTFGGIVTHFISWRWIFVLNFPLAAIVIWRARRDVPDNAPNTRGPFDVFGLSLLCVGLLALMDGLTTARITTSILGLAVLTGFVFWQRKARNPILPLATIGTPQLIKTYALELAIGMLEGSLFFIPAVLVASQHLSYVAAGLVAALGALMFVLVIPVSGRALDRIGSRNVLVAGAILTEIGLAMFALGFMSLMLTLLSMIVAGCGFGALLGAPTRYIVTNETREQTRATAVGLLSQALIVGQILGGSLAGGVMSIEANEILGYRYAYLAFCAVAVVALALAAGLKSRSEERTVPLEEAA